MHISYTHQPLHLGCQDGKWQAVDESPSGYLTGCRPVSDAMGAVTPTLLNQFVSTMFQTPRIDVAAGAGAFAEELRLHKHRVEAAALHTIAEHATLDNAIDQFNQDSVHPREKQTETHSEKQKNSIVETEDKSKSGGFFSWWSVPSVFGGVFN